MLYLQPTIIFHTVPVLLDVEWPSPKSTTISDTITYHILIPLWAHATQAQIEQYQSRLDFYLSNIVIPYTSLLCKDFCLDCFFSYI